MAVDKLGNASDGVQISATPVSPDPVKPVEPPAPKPAKIPEPTPAPKPVAPAPVVTVVPEPVPVVEPEPVAEPVSVKFIRSADGNIAASEDCVFAKTSEVTVLEKASSIELNEQKTLLSVLRAKGEGCVYRGVCGKSGIFDIQLMFAKRLVYAVE